MKGVALFLFILFSTLCRTQTLDTIIDNRFSESLEKKPLYLKKGDKIVINTDSMVYLVNKKRYDYCKDLAKDDCVNQYGILLKNFNASISERDKLMANMTTINDSCLVQTKRLLEVYEKNVTEVRSTLASTQTTLEHANNGLKTSLEELKNVRKESLKNKILLGIGCTGIGLVLGMLLGR